MGYDFITNGERHVHLPDIDIWMLRHFLLREASKSTPTDLYTDNATLHKLLRHIEGWNWIGPGVVTGTELSDFIQHQAQRQRVLHRLFERAITSLEGFGEVIPLAYLEQNLRGPMAEFAAPQPTGRLVRALRQLTELVM